MVITLGCLTIVWSPQVSLVIALKSTKTFDLDCYCSSSLESLQLLKRPAVQSKINSLSMKTQWHQ
jgi:hypothetical protein